MNSDRKSLDSIGGGKCERIGWAEMNLEEEMAMMPVRMEEGNQVQCHPIACRVDKGV